MNQSFYAVVFFILYWTCRATNFVRVHERLDVKANPTSNCGSCIVPFPEISKHPQANAAQCCRNCNVKVIDTVKRGSPTLSFSQIL